MKMKTKNSKAKAHRGRVDNKTGGLIMAKKKIKRMQVTVVSFYVDKKYAEAIIEKKLTKQQLKDLPDFLDYLDDQFWDDVNDGIAAALKDWFEDTKEEE